MSAQLKVGVIGGFGLMASPMARHWRSSSLIHVARVHDRGQTSERHRRIRAEWKDAGAYLVRSTAELYESGELDGFFICVGKNGDDLALLRELSQGIQADTRPKARPFICHLSTVSVRFVEAADRYFSSLGIPYVNYPLTGGPLGAEKAAMLILASGPHELFQKLEPSLKLLGKPRHFGTRATAATEIKLMGHMMSFDGLMGICSAAAVHSQRFQDGEVGGAAQAEFFDFLNGGAGGTRQWDVILSAGIRNGTWTEPFLARYGLLDAIYTAEMMLDAGLAGLSVHSMINVAAAFAYLVLEKGAHLATHAILHELFGKRGEELDSWASRLSASPSARVRLESLVALLPETLQRALRIDIVTRDFAEG